MDRRRYEGLAVRQVIRSLLRNNDVVHYHGQYVTCLMGLPPRAIPTFHDYAGVCPVKTLFRGENQCDTTNSRDCGPCYFANNIGPLRESVSARQVDRWRSEVLKSIEGRVNIFVSNAQLALWERYLDAPIHAEVIENFIDYRSIKDIQGISKLEARRRLELPPGRPIVFLASAPAAYKGTTQFLREWIKSPSEALTLVGGWEALEPSVSTSESNEVRPLGWLPRESVLRYMKACDVFVMPSLCPEPSPTAVLEASALGIPVVAMDRGGIPGMAGNAHGLVRVADSLVGVCGEIRRILTEPDLSSLASPSVPMSAEAAVKRLVGVYSDALQKKEENS